LDWTSGKVGPWAGTLHSPFGAKGKQKSKNLGSEGNGEGEKHKDSGFWNLKSWADVQDHSGPIFALILIAPVGHLAEGANEPAKPRVGAISHGE
jgi:hypothetical protein